MNAQQFAGELCKRLNLRRGQTIELAFEEAERAANKVAVEKLPQLLELCLDHFSAVPARADILGLAEKNGYATRCSAYSDYQAYECTECKGFYSIDHQGTRCPYCGCRKTANQRVILSAQPIALTKGKISQPNASMGA